MNAAADLHLTRAQNVCYTAVLCHTTLLPTKKALRDGTKNSCVADLRAERKRKKNHEIPYPRRLTAKLDTSTSTK